LLDLSLARTGGSFQHTMPSATLELFAEENTSPARGWSYRILALRWLAVATALVLAAPSILLAHARLVRSQPHAGERLTGSPANLRLVFSETPMVAVSRIVLIGAGGDTIPLSPVRVDPVDAHALIADIVPTLDSGKYSVHWTAAGSDGHPSRGVFSFTVITPRSGASASTGENAPAVESAGASGAAGPAMQGESAAAAARSEGAEVPVATAEFSYSQMIARWIGFLALFCVIGTVAFRYAVVERVRHSWGTDDPFPHIVSTGAATLGMFAAVALLLTTVIKLYDETAAMHEVPLRTILLATGWGWAWMAQTAACLLAIVAFRIAHAASGKGWPLAMLCAFVLVVTPALTGHAIASDEALFSVPLDILHVIAGSVWLGTLAVILIVGLAAAGKTPGEIGAASRVATLVNAFSPIALICGGAIVVTGVTASLLNLEPFSRLWTSTYGVMLVRKLVFVALLLTLGAWNWRKVKPSLGGETGLAQFRRSAKLELMAAAMVLAVTAALVALALPG
jgi:putative copper export protein/methionine-rich copper-binding protein CopC